MRVLLLNSYYAPNLLGGSERSVQTLAETLQQRGHEVVVISLATNQQDSQDTVNGVRVHYLADGNFGRSTADPRRGSVDRMLWHLSGEFIARNTAVIHRLIESERPDVVHTNALGGMSCGAIWRAARGKGLPVVHTVRDYHLLCARGVMVRRGRDCGTPCRECSRNPVRLEEESRLLGQTGKSVKPKLPITAGTSGAVQYTTGIQGAETIIAINRDPHAPILKMADLGLVGDAKTVLTLVLEKLRKRL